MQQAFSAFFYLLISAVFFVWLFKRVNLPPILAYLMVGILAGQYGFGWLAAYDQIHYVAELGIVFLLFSLGLEFSIPRLKAMRHIVFGLGSLQVFVTTLVFYFILIAFGFTWLSALSIASLIALSSTAIVVKHVSESGSIQTRQGQLSIGILLFQDIAVVPLLIALPLLAQPTADGMWGPIGFALAKGVVVCIVLWAIGRWLLPRIFSEVAQVRTDELFVLTTLLVALIAGALTHTFGLSMALGAFLAGMMLGESQYRHQLESDIRPFRDILMGLFFVTVGMQLEMPFVVAQSGWILIGLIGLLVIKFIVISCLARLFGESKKHAFATGFMLCQMGEFGFVLVSLALKHQLVESSDASLLMAIGVLSMAITPLLIDKSEIWSVKLLQRFGSEPQTATTDSNEQSESFKDHVVICGYGRVGQSVSRFLKPEAIPYIALDIDPIRVKEAQAAGEQVKFGQAKHKSILASIGVEHARLVIITFADYTNTMHVVSAIRQLSDSVKILVRMRDDQYLTELKAAGVSEVVPESLEASLMLVAHVMYMSGVPVKRVLRRVQSERKNRYGMLHGYFPGENTDLSARAYDRLEHLHAIALTDDAYAIGKTIIELDLELKRIDVTGLRRNGNEIAYPDPTTQLICQDILIVRGKPRRVERFERFLLEGP